MKTRRLSSIAVAVVVACLGAVAATPADAADDVTPPTAFSITPDTVTPFVMGKLAGYYRQNAVVLADYECRDEIGGSGIASCAGTVPDGSPIDTSTLGSHEFQIVATDNAGNTSTLQFTYAVMNPATVSISSATVVENDNGRRALKLGVTMTNGYVPASVGYTTHAGTADSGDYLSRSGSVSFWKVRTNKGGSSVQWTRERMISIPLLSDTTAEDDEEFTVDLTPQWPATTPVDIVDGTGTVTILNDDPTPGQRVSVSDVTAREGSALYFTVSLANPATAAITVPFTITGVTATGGPQALADGDFITKTPGTVKFGAGQRVKDLVLKGRVDTTAESDETLQVTLGTPTGGAALYRATGTGTILDDDS